jgi:hypothetical protein
MIQTVIVVYELDYDETRFIGAFSSKEIFGEFVDYETEKMKKSDRFLRTGGYSGSDKGSVSFTFLINKDKEESMQNIHSVQYYYTLIPVDVIPLIKEKK